MRPSGGFCFFFALLLASVSVGGCQRPGLPAGDQGVAQPASPAKPGAELRRATFAAAGSAAVVRAASEYPAPTDTVAAPLSLTASDGTGLALVALEARTVIEGPLAFTELALRFRNPRDRIIEGRFAITLPDDAAISRLAMEIDGRWQEAEVVERQRARRVYEDFLHRKQDPALLEKEAGNEFRARVFPIPARADKKIIVSFSHDLEASGAPYELPLQGLPEIEELSLEVLRADGKGRYQKSQKQYRNHQPKDSFSADQVAGLNGLAAGRLAVVRVSPRLATDTVDIKRARILFDTSASRAPGFAGEIDRLRDVVAAMAQRHKELDIELVAFDTDVQVIYRGPATDFGADEVAALRARRPLGASDLHGVLASLESAEPRERLLLFTDGIATAGPDEAGEIARAAARVPGTQRIDVILSGGIRDRELAAALARGTAARDGIVADTARSASDLAAALSSATVSGVAVEVPGAEFVWPRSLDGLLPGDERLVYVGMKTAVGDSLAVRLDGPVSDSIDVPVAKTARPLLERAIARARIGAMSADLAAMKPDAPGRAPLKQAIIDLSIQHRVLSDFTALLVLETERDYQRYGIDRSSLANILTIGPQGVTTQSRSDAVIAVDPVAVAKDDKRAEKKKRAPARGLDDLATESPAEGADGTPGVADDEDRGTAAAANAPAPPPRAAPAARRPAAREADAAEETEEIVAEAVPGARQSASMGAAAGSGMDLRRAAPADEADAEPDASAKPSGPPPLTGKLADIAAALERGEVERALVDALVWQREQPGDVLALLALGEAVEAQGNLALAARVYGSILDLFPSRADMRRMAAQRLERLGKLGAELAVDALKTAASQRPDHLTGHRQLAYAYVRADRLADAFAALESGLAGRYRGGHAPGGDRILREDLGIVGQAWATREPGERARIAERLAAAGARFADGPSTRFVISWETDANDVDFHIRDGKGNHASYQNKQLATGGELFADVTNGYGPECFAIPGTMTAPPYRLSVHYYSRGPMGYGMGELEILHHDGAGALRIESRPFVVMNDQAYVDLGSVPGAVQIAGPPPAQ